MEVSKGFSKEPSITFSVRGIVKKNLMQLYFQLVKRAYHLMTPNDCMEHLFFIAYVISLNDLIKKTFQDFVTEIFSKEFLTNL